MVTAHDAAAASTTAPAAARKDVIGSWDGRRRAAALLIALGPWMIARLTGFARSLYLTIPSLGG